MTVVGYEGGIMTRLAAETGPLDGLGIGSNWAVRSLHASNALKMSGGSRQVDGARVKPSNHPKDATS